MTRRLSQCTPIRLYLPFIISHKQTHYPFIHFKWRLSKIIKKAHKIRDFSSGKWWKMVTVETGHRIAMASFTEKAGAPPPRPPPP
jgi:hypothetical protein